MVRSVRSVLMLPVLLAIVASTLAAQGAVPPVLGQAPGFHRMILGDFEITALNDGVVPFQSSTITGATPEQIRTGLAEWRLADPVDMSYNGLLVNTGTGLVLIDTGTGGMLPDSPWFKGTGRLLANLRAAGYQPEQVTLILISHRGPDHIGGLVRDGRRVFPNATVRVASREVEGFLDPAKVAAAVAAATNKEATKAWLGTLAGLFQPYLDAGRYQPFDADIELVPGIKAMATPGHTAGHTTYVVESRGQRLYVLGDLVHWGSVQFRYPAASTAFDENPKEAAAARLRLMERAAAEDAWVAGAHLAFPGIGHVRAAEGRFFWVPANYSIPR